MRHATSNVFFDFMRLRIYNYVYFLMLFGCLPHFIFYFPRDKCLHTYSARDFGINWTDYYQYCLTMLSWVITVPVVIYFCGTALRDNFKYFMYPFLVANLVFIFTSCILAFIVLLFGLIGAYHPFLQCLIGFDLFVLFYMVAGNFIYQKEFAQKDLLRSAEEEVH